VIRAIVVVAAMTAVAHADVELWTEVGVQRQLGRRISVEVDQQTRFDAGVSRLGALIPELSIEARLARWLRLGTSYRFEYTRDKHDEMVVRHRIDTDLQVRGRIGRVKITGELELQEKVRPESRDQLRHVLRERVELAYHRHHWTPAVSVAVFQALRDSMTRPDKLWFTVGATRHLERRDFELFYRLEVPQAAPGDPLRHIVGMAFHSAL